MSTQRPYPANRGVAYNEFFERCLKLSENSDSTWCCIAVDIQKFRLFNDLFGPEKGDYLIAQINDLMAAYAAEAGGIFQHLQQDDFVAFIPYERETIDSIFEDAKIAMSKLGSNFGATPAVGYYVIEQGQPIEPSMYDKALAALEDAKKTFVDRVRQYDPAVHRNEADDFALLLKLRDAVPKDQITFFLQPQCRMSSGKIVGAEALVRWRDDDGKFISPATFIPILEKHGFIAALDVYLWIKVFEWLHSLMDRGIQPIPVSINVSQGDIMTIDVPKRLKGLCEQYQVPADLVKIEITETSFAENYDVIQDFVEQVRSMGFLVMMDDLGSGYSSLSMLEYVSVDVLKLDMAFIKAFSRKSRKGITILESMVNMSKTLSLPIVVEGVETEEQRTFLKNLGCRYAQGYYFHRPMSVEDFEQLLANEDNLDRKGFVVKKNEQIHVREFLDENTFTDSMLNNVLGAVAFYQLDGKDLTITRFNEQFYQAIADDSMESRQKAIQHYVVRDDWPHLYAALEQAEAYPTNGGTCEIRFYKSDDSVFWFRMHFFYLASEGSRKIFYGRVEDVTVEREQSLQLLDVLRQRSEATMVIDLDRNRIQYVAADSSISQIGMPYLDLATSCNQTAQTRIDCDEDRQRFLEFFNAERLETMLNKAVYHEELRINFRLRDKFEPVTFSIYHIRVSKDLSHMVYAFAQRV